MRDKIKQLAKQYAPEFIEIRHHLHAHPELSFQEFETSKFVQGKLKEFGIPFEIKATTGVVGIINGKNPGKRIIALRGDRKSTRLNSSHSQISYAVFCLKKKKNKKK